MAKFILKNIVRLALLLLAVSFVANVLIAASPVDPVQANVGQVAWISMSEEKREALAEYYGADTSLWERYGTWLVNVLHGDWGISFRYNAPVADVIAIRAGNTLLLMVVAWVISGILGFVLGILAAVKRSSWVDKVVKAYSFIMASTPTFWLGLIVLIVFAVWLKWFPVGFSIPIGMNAADVTILDSLHHLVLPALTLSITGVAQIALHTREKTIDVLESDYIRYARARGMSTWSAVRHHGLRNLLLPAITLQFASVAEIFGGSVLVEQVFSYPGLGQAAVTAGLGGDAALLTAIAVISAAIVFGGNLIANVLYGVIDPRIRRGEAPQHG